MEKKLGKCGSKIAGGLGGLFGRGDDDDAYVMYNRSTIHINFSAKRIVISGYKQINPQSYVQSQFQTPSFFIGIILLGTKAFV